MRAAVGGVGVGVGSSMWEGLVEPQPHPQRQTLELESSGVMS